MKLASGVSESDFVGLCGGGFLERVLRENKTHITGLIMSDPDILVLKEF